MSRYQQGSLYKVARKTCQDVWVFQWYDSSTGNRVRKKQIIGSASKIKTRRAAENAAASLHVAINAGRGTPRTVSELAAHYKLKELTGSQKVCSTIENHRVLFKNYIQPRWGHIRLNAVRTIQVEEWLHSLPLTPSSKAKIKGVLSSLYNYAIRQEWLTFNPISRVRTAGQMHLYLNYARENWPKEGENPPVGLILFAEKGVAEARYALDNLPNKVLAAE